MRWMQWRAGGWVSSSSTQRPWGHKIGALAVQCDCRPERSHGAHYSTRFSRPDRHQERFDADDVHHAREVVGEYVQRHLGRHIR
jgi:hypothetical protein